MKTLPLPLGLLSLSALALAGLIGGGLTKSNDPELVLAACFALGGLGLIGVVALGVTLGNRISRPSPPSLDRQSSGH